MNTSNNAGLYIHIPFCSGKCPYCGFYSIASISLVSRWLAALKKEVTHYENRFQSFDSLYLGGGTPTLLRTDELEEILNHVFTHFNFAPNTEVTIEANPGDLTPEKTDHLKMLGFNRLSAGIQSFNDQELVFLGRRHSREDAEIAITNLRTSGFTNIGIDTPCMGLRDSL